MNSVLVVARKELTDLFRDRRTVMLGLLLMPLLFPAMILGAGSLACSHPVGKHPETAGDRR